jgi:hypothetical protein
MNNKNIKDELKYILQGKGCDSQRNLIEAIADFLRKSAETSTMAQRNESSKDQETTRLIEYINTHNLWNCDINFSLFISQGAEQRVYIQNKTRVLKLNDAIYYLSWVDYFNNLLLNNYFFPDTAYELTGFYKTDANVIYALVSQNYVEADQPTDLLRVKQFLESNGFNNTKNHDYYNPDLGIILEDLHDENVLTKNDYLYFIDTVFYIKPEIFWN